MIQMDQPESIAVPVRVLRMRDLRDRLQLSASQVFSLVARGIFPKPFSLAPGGRAVGWLESDVSSWILQRKAAAEASNLKFSDTASFDKNDGDINIRKLLTHSKKYKSKLSINPIQFKQLSGASAAVKDSK